MLVRLRKRWNQNGQYISSGWAALISDNAIAQAGVKCGLWKSLDRPTPKDDWRGIEVLNTIGLTTENLARIAAVPPLEERVAKLEFQIENLGPSAV
jgi:hypothetical protein